MALGVGTSILGVEAYLDWCNIVRGVAKVVLFPLALQVLVGWVLSTVPLISFGLHFR